MIYMIYSVNRLQWNVQSILSVGISALSSKINRHCQDSHCYLNHEHNYWTRYLQAAEFDGPLAQSHTTHVGFMYFYLWICCDVGMTATTVTLKNARTRKIFFYKYVCPDLSLNIKCTIKWCFGDLKWSTLIRL